MRIFKSIPLSGIDVTIFIILIFLSFGAFSKLWELADNIILNPKEFNDMDIDKPIIRPYKDVFFYFNSQKLQHNKIVYQKIQRNELILESIVGVSSATIFISLILQLRKLLYTTKQKTFFLKENLVIVRKIAYLLGLWIFFDFVLYQCIQFFIPLSFVQDSINYVPINKGVLLSFILSINYSLLLAAFSFYVISVVFKEGSELKEQSELTI